jgi:hypothetical protein
MDRRSLYDEDYFAWLQQQAAALRRLAQSRRDLPNDLEIEQIAEEIEDVGKSELRATRSFIRNILIHLLLVAFDLHSSARGRWKSELLVFHAGLKSFATLSMRQLIDMNALWNDAIEVADARLQDYASQLPRRLPSRCPLSFDQMISDSIDWDELIQRIGTGPTNPEAQSSDRQRLP